MRDNDDLGDIPSMVPDRDEVVDRQHARRQPDLVKPVSYAETIKVSTWPVRIMLGVLTVAILAGTGLAYTVYEENLRRLDQANARIMDIEDRLSMVGDSAEETTGNIIERVDFNFSEIDKLWAARNATNANVTDLTGRVAITETRSQENLTLVEETNQRLLQATNLVEENRRSVAELRQASERLAANVNNMNNTLQEVRGVAQEVVNLRAEISTAEGASGGLNDRLMRVEEAVEAIDAYRLQVNQTVLRLQQQIEDMRAN